LALADFDNLDRRTPLSKREANQICPSETGTQRCPPGCLINYHPSSLMMTDEPPFAITFRAAVSKGHGRMKGETHEKYKYHSQSNRKNWVHPTVAVRHSDPYFDCDISAAWLRLKTIGQYRVNHFDRRADHCVRWGRLLLDQETIRSCPSYRARM